MNLLLDTHIWVWGLVEPGRMPRRISSALRRSGAVHWISPVSVWETLVLIEKGRLSVRGSPRSWVEAALASHTWTEAPLTTPVAIESRSVDMATQNPADRFLAATARVYDLTLVTEDKVFRDVDGVSVLMG